MIQRSPLGANPTFQRRKSAPTRVRFEMRMRWQYGIYSQAERINNDMRHLSKWKLTIGGIPLDVLSTDSNEYYYAQHFCVPPTGTIYKNPTISIVRRRFVGNGFVEDHS